MPDITAIPEALRQSRFLILRAGSKQPARGMQHAKLEYGAPWDESVDAFLARGSERLGVFMAGRYVVLDADLKQEWEDDGHGAQVFVVTKNGNDDVARLMSEAGIEELPRTVKIRTQGGGTHWYFEQNPACRVTQRRIGFLDVRAAPNAYCAIGAGYQLLDDGGGALAVLPETLARAIMSTNITPAEYNGDPAQNGHALGTALTAYGDKETAFNNWLTQLKGTLVRGGCTNDEANEAVWRLNEVSRDPLSRDEFDGTVGRDKGWTPGEILTQTEIEWARRQVGIGDDDPENAYLDVPTVKRLWTTERWREFQDLENLDDPVREKLDDVLDEPPPEPVISGMMTIGLYGVAGPPESGKSLLARDLADVVANGLSWQEYNCLRARAATIVISEGHHDLQERWARVRRDSIYIYRKPIILTNGLAVDRFIQQHEGSDTGLVIFDLIYHMGIQDDNKAVDVGPVLKACRRISQEMSCAVFVVGHPGHATGRRFCGTRIWRDWFDGEFHMADGMFTCEKHKYARKETFEQPYEVIWPGLHYLDASQHMGRYARLYRIREELELHPEESTRALAEKLSGELGGVSMDRWRQLIAQEKRAIEKKQK